MIVEAHPLLDLAVLRAAWPTAIGEVPVAPWIDDLVRADAPVPFPTPGPGDVEAVRALLRHGGFKPAGRSRPCSEYVRRALDEGKFPRIGAVVDLTNLAALHGAVPVSTVDPDRLSGDLRVALAAPDASYVFNASGQTIALGGLLCLHDDAGPCANAVKDAQRAKTTADSRSTLTLVWGTVAMPGRAAAVADWLTGACRRLGADVERVC